MADRSERRFVVGLSVITFVALAWRVGYVLWWHYNGLFGARTKLNGDAAYYHLQANDIANGLWFIDPGQHEFFGRITPSAGHPPNYILFLAFVSRFIGRSATTHRLASTLLGAAAVFLLGLLARRLFDSRLAGLAAAGFAAVYANLWINDEMLMSEGMYVLTIAIMLLVAYRFWNGPTWRRALLVGITVGLAANSRSEAILLFPLLAIPFAFMTRAVPMRTRWKHAVLVVVGGALIVGPWVLYNATRFQHPVTLSNGTGSVLMVANCDFPGGSTYSGAWAGYWSIFCASDLDGKIDRSFPSERARYLKQQLGVIPGTDEQFFGDESTHEVAWRAVGLYEIGRHKSQLPKAVVLRVARMWELYPWSWKTITFRATPQNDRYNDVLEGRGCETKLNANGDPVLQGCWQSRLATMQYFPLLGLSIAGLVVLRRRRVPILPLTAIALTVTLAAATTFGITRYRAPVDAALTVLAGGAVAVAVERRRTRRGGPGAPASPPRAEPGETATAPVGAVAP